MNTKKAIKYIISLGAAALMLYYSFRGVDWDAFISGMNGCRWEFIALAMVSSVAAFFFRSQRWRILIKPFDPDMEVLTTFNGVNIGYLANFVFPRIGEFIRCGFVSRRSASRHKADPENAVSYDRTLGTVLLSRTWDMAVVFILIAFLLALRWQKFGEFFTRNLFDPLQSRIDFHAGWIFGGIAALAAAVVWAVIHFRNSSTVLRKAADFLGGMAEGFRSCLRMENKTGFFIYTILLWGTYWLMSMSVIWAMPQLGSLNWVDAWFICLAGSVAWMIPVPGGFGAYHGVVALALTSIYSLAWNDGILYATINHEAQAITMIVCGIISYFIEIIRK